MVMVAVGAVASEAPTGEDRVAVKVSGCSVMESSRVVSASVWVVVPGANVTRMVIAV